MEIAAHGEKCYPGPVASKERSRSVGRLEAIFGSICNSTGRLGAVDTFNIFRHMEKLKSLKGYQGLSKFQKLQLVPMLRNLAKEHAKEANKS